MKTQLHIQTILRETQALFGVHRKRTFIFFALFLCLEGISQLQAQSENFLSIVGVMIAVMFIAVQIMYLYALEHGAVSLRKNITATYKYIIPVVFASLIAVFACGIGLILFILPGLYLFCALALIAPLIVFENKNVIASLSESFDRTKGYKMTIFYLLAIYIAVSVLAAFMVSATDNSGISLIVAAALHAVFSLYFQGGTYIIYKHLRPHTNHVESSHLEQEE